MPKTRIEKEEVVTALVDGFKKAKGVVLANFQGLSVSDFEQLRSSCFKEQTDILVAKKTLLKRAFAESGIPNTPDPDGFSGGIAVVMGYGDELAPAKTVNTFAKAHEVVSIYGGILEGKFLSAVEVKILANLPSKVELLTKLVGSLNAPISGFVNVLAGNLRSLVSVLNNVREAKAKV